MSHDMTLERENELIEEAAQFIVKHSLVEVAKVWIDSTVPFGDFVGQLGYLMGFLPVTALFGHGGIDMINLVGFDYKASFKKIMDRSIELKEEKDQIEQERLEKEKLKARKKRKLSFFHRSRNNSE